MITNFAIGSGSIDYVKLNEPIKGDGLELKVQCGGQQEVEYHQEIPEKQMFWVKTRGEYSIGDTFYLAWDNIDFIPAFKFEIIEGDEERGDKVRISCVDNSVQFFMFPLSIIYADILEKQLLANGDYADYYLSQLNSDVFLLRCDGNSHTLYPTTGIDKFKVLINQAETFNATLVSNGGTWDSKRKELALKDETYRKTETYNKQETDGKLSNKTDNSEFLNLRDRVDEIELFSKPNLTIMGKPTIQGGQVSDFSSDDYLLFPQLTHIHGRSFELMFAIATPSDMTAQQNIIDSDKNFAIAIRNGKFVIALSSDGETWDIGEYTGITPLQPETTYYVKFVHTVGSNQYMIMLSYDGDVWGEDIRVRTDKELAEGKDFVVGISYDGVHVFRGSVNLNVAYLKLDGQVVWKGVDDCLDTSLDNLSDKGKETVKNLAKQAPILWYGTQEQYDALEDKTEFSLYVISE